MRELRRAAIRLAATLSCVYLIGCGPLVMIPGGALSGDVQPPPADWTFSDATETVQLETRPEDPYSVNIWGAAVGPRFYVAAGDPTSRWVDHIEADPRVRLRIENAVYELVATRTEDPGERNAFLAAVKRKYDFEPDAEQRGQAALFRLEPR
ncbi:MAG: hypothetical protein MJE66_16390 [Proteobacteria bacterium]|nr:hypothetical protein [Pseudomonadota bacterium]